MCAPAAWAQGSDDRFANDIDAKERRACRPDVERLCNEYVPDVQQIIACMLRNKASLSPACAEVFAVPKSCKADVRTSCKDYLVAIPSVTACLKRNLDAGNLEQDCAQEFAATQAPAAPDRPTKKKPAKKAARPNK